MQEQHFTKSISMDIICGEYACTEHGACMEIPVLLMIHTWNTLAPRMEYTSTTHGICLYHAWNIRTPVPRRDMPVRRMKHTFIMHEMFQFHVHSMHEMQALIHACT